MSQGANWLPTTGVYSGLTAANDTNAALDALLTENSGSSAPTNALGGVPKLGQTWLDTTSATLPIFKRYTGSAWVVEAVIDVTNGIWMPVIGGGIGTVASSGTTDLGASPQAVQNVTGVTTITSFGSNCAKGSRKILIFGGILTLTYDAVALIIPGGSNVTTAAGDVAEAVYLGSGNWRVLNYVPLVGVSVLTTVRVEPQGYLTLTTLTPIITADVISATSVFYTPYKGNLIQIYNGTAFVLTTFSELTLALVASHTLSTIYDCFVINDAGTIRLVTGPAWSVNTAGACGRGTGAGTTELQRLNGLLVNHVSMTARYGASTTTVAANQGTYVGSIFIDGVAGQVTCHRSYGQSRKWGVWNAYNRNLIVLQIGDPTASWNNAPTTWRQSRADATNFGMAFSGLAEESVDAAFSQNILITAAAGNTTTANIGIGVNVTNALTGMMGVAQCALTGGTTTSGMETAKASATIAPIIGINQVNMIEQAPSGTTNNNYQAASANNLMKLVWRG